MVYNRPTVTGGAIEKEVTRGSISFHCCFPLLDLSNDGNQQWKEVKSLVKLDIDRKMF